MSSNKVVCSWGHGVGGVDCRAPLTPKGDHDDCGGDGEWGLMGPFCMTCRNTWMWSPDCLPPWPSPAEYKQGVSLRRWLKKLKAPRATMELKKKIAEVNDTTPPHPPTPFPEALRVTYRKQEDISQWKVRRGRDVISGSQFKRLFSRSLQLLIWVINLHCAALMCHVTADTCCFKWRLKVSYSLGRLFHPVSERPPEIEDVPWVLFFVFVFVLGWVGVIHFSYFFCFIPLWHPFVTSQRDAKRTGYWHYFFFLYQFPCKTAALWDNWLIRSLKWMMTIWNHRMGPLNSSAFRQRTFSHSRPPQTLKSQRRFKFSH